MFEKMTVYFKHSALVKSLFTFLSGCAFSWASKDDVWNNLLRKDQLYLHNVHVMERHPNLQPKMRAILLDWLIEVCVCVRALD